MNVNGIICWLDSHGVSRSQTTLTNDQGEYWFEWLRPGIEYTVTERAPSSSRQSTPNPQPIRILSSHEFVATPDQGKRVQEIIHFPWWWWWWWEVTVDPEPMGLIDPPPELIRFEGMVGIWFSDAIDVNNPTGAPIPIIDRQNGLPVALPDGQFEVQTEIVSLSLTGNDSLGRDVMLPLSPNAPSLGQILVDALPGDDFLTGDSFFDVFVEIDIVEPAKLHGFTTLHTNVGTTHS